MDKKVSADIRNKLTPIKTALELLAQNKPIPKDFAQTAIKSLEELEEMLDETKHQKDNCS